MSKSRRTILKLLAAATATGTVAFIPVGGADVSGMAPSGEKAKDVDLSNYSSDPPDQPVDLLFIHHSVGGQWLADAGRVEGANSIHQTHPNGGGLRRLLREQGYAVHEASYGSRLGEATDLFDWLPKFRDRMADVLTCGGQDQRLPDGGSNGVVMFKSCYPNNLITGEADGVGNPNGPQRTLANARATYEALLESFARHPDVLFVCVTTPPLAPRVRAQPLWRVIVRAVLNRPRPSLPETARGARRLANWLKAEDGWLKQYRHPNVVVFDYYDVLTGDGASDLSTYASAGNSDSHPSREGQTLAARRFIPFLNRAVSRLNLSRAQGRRLRQ